MTHLCSYHPSYLPRYPSNLLHFTIPPLFMYTAISKPTVSHPLNSCMVMHGPIPTLMRHHDSLPASTSTYPTPLSPLPRLPHLACLPLIIPTHLIHFLTFQYIIPIFSHHHPICPSSYPTHIHIPLNLSHSNKSYHLADYYGLCLSYCMDITISRCHLSQHDRKMLIGGWPYLWPDHWWRRLPPRLYWFHC